MSKVFLNCFETCKCTNACEHSGKTCQSYAPEYLQVLMEVKPKVVLEWGPGMNTYLALAVGAVVHSVEHNPIWIPHLHSTNFIVHAIPLEDVENYVMPLEDLSSIDVFFIDSGHRERCLLEISKHCREDAITCLHDAQRERYHTYLKLFDYVKFLNRGFAVASFQERVLYFPTGDPRYPA